MDIGHGEREWVIELITFSIDSSVSKYDVFSETYNYVTIVKFKR